MTQFLPKDRCIHPVKNQTQRNLTSLIRTQDFLLQYPERPNRIYLWKINVFAFVRWDAGMRSLNILLFTEFMTGKAFRIHLEDNCEIFQEGGGGGVQLDNAVRGEL